MYNEKNRKIAKIMLSLVVVFATILLTIFLYQKFFLIKKDEIIKGNGRVEARETIISTKFSGRILEILVDEGDVVKKGDLLAVLDSRSFESDIVAQKAKLNEISKNIDSVDAEIKATNSDIKFYKKELERTKTLMKQNFASQLELDRNSNLLEKTEAKLSSLIANKKSLQASYKSLEASIKTMEIDLSDMKIYAPTNGVLLYKLAEDGEMLSAGGKLFIMYNPDDLYMTIYMSSDKAGQVKIGESAKIKLDAYPNKTFDAKVTFVAENAEFTPKEVETQEEREKLVFRVKLTIEDNSSREAKPGMPGDGFIKLNSSANWSDAKF